MKILVVGSGAREHALCWRIRQDRPSAELFCAPGNGGIGMIAQRVKIAAEDVSGLTDWSRRERPELVVVGPEAPLALGLVERLRGAGILAFGPTSAAARIETSKAWAAELLQSHGIPAPDQAVFDDPDAAKSFIRAGGAGVVVKASGLAQAKGALVCRTVDSALRAVDRIMRERAFGAAGDQIVIQELLTGNELSVFAICDGVDFRVLGAARDYKRAQDGDAGLNTGGMGAYAPVADAPPALVQEVASKILGPTLAAMQAAGSPYHGVLYAGLMITAKGPRVFEFNCRFGDPEAQVMLPGLQGDLAAALKAAAEGRLGDVELAPGHQAAVCVVVASGGYPGSYETGFPISGVDQVPDGALVFHAGTEVVEGELVTAGGRVLSAVGLGENVEAARDRAYELARAVRFEGAYFRSDIAAAIPAGAVG